MALIRSATPDDVEAIARVHIASWITTYRGLMPDAVLDTLSFERRRDWWKNIVSEHGQQVPVAEAEGQIVGFAYFGAERENDPVYRGELYAIYLLGDYQHRGFGRKLVKSCAQGLLELGFNNMLLWVLSQNPARRFYEKLGGLYLRDKPLELGGTTLQESAYGWNDLQLLAELK